MRRLAETLLLLALIPASAAAWGANAHFMISRTAIDAAASQLPEFMAAAKSQIVYNAFEPDRWKDETKTPLAAAQAPDHIFNTERWGTISTIDDNRFAFMEKLSAGKIELARMGYLPYSIMEMYGRLRSAFRQWRAAKTPEDREGARANAVLYAGLLGHYVGDGSQPLHLTIHFNGWDSKAPNPNGYSTTPGIHSIFETAFIKAAIDANHVRTKVKSPQRLTNVFGAVREYLTQTFNEVDALYALEKAGEFNPENPKSKGVEFVEVQLARASTMLGNLWYTAWIESGEPLNR